MKWSKNWTKTIMAVSVIITIIGIVTGKFIFLFLLLPLGWFNFKKEDSEE